MPTSTSALLAEPPGAPPREEDVPRKLTVRDGLQDRIYMGGVRSVAFLVLLIVGSIGLFLGLQARPTLSHYGLGFITENRWLPNQDIIGIQAVVVGTAQVAVCALVISIPMAFLTALFITDWAPAWMRPTLIRLVDLMAAVPGIVFGLFVLFSLQPQVEPISHWASKYLGFFPLFKVHTDVDYPIWDHAPGAASYGGSAFIASLAVAMVIFPMATSVMREVFGEAPVGEKEAAIALGASRFAMVRSVVVPFGRSGIIGGSMLALGRALGETISVLLIISQSFEVKLRPLESGTSTISALIANMYKEATPAQLSALLTAGFVLFLITLLVNTLAAMIVSRSRSGAGTEL